MHPGQNHNSCTLLSVFLFVFIVGPLRWLQSLYFIVRLGGETIRREVSLNNLTTSPPICLISSTTYCSLSIPLLSHNATRFSLCTMRAFETANFFIDDTKSKYPKPDPVAFLLIFLVIMRRHQKRLRRTLQVSGPLILNQRCWQIMFYEESKLRSPLSVPLFGALGSELLLSDL